MSVRVQTSGVSGTGATETKRAEQTSGIPRHGSDSRVDLGADDRIEISSLSAAISAAADADQADRAERVRAIGALYQSGRYQVDSAKLASAMVSHALAAHEMDGVA